MTDNEMTDAMNTAALALAKTDEDMAVNMLNAFRQITRERNDALSKCQRYYDAVKSAWEVATEKVPEWMMVKTTPKTNVI